MTAPYRGVSLQQDNRFSDQQKKLLKKLKFPKEYSLKVDVSKVNMDVVTQWIQKRTAEILGGLEDDVLVGMIVNLLQQPNLDPRKVQIEITGFLERNTPTFMRELWILLADASTTPEGIPNLLLLQEQEVLKKLEAKRAQMELRLSERLQRNSIDQKIASTERVRIKLEADLAEKRTGIKSEPGESRRVADGKPVRRRRDRRFSRSKSRSSSPENRRRNNVSRSPNRRPSRFRSKTRWDQPKVEPSLRAAAASPSPKRGRSRKFRRSPSRSASVKRERSESVDRRSKRPGSVERQSKRDRPGPVNRRFQRNTYRSVSPDVHRVRSVSRSASLVRKSKRNGSVDRQSKRNRSVERQSKRLEPVNRRFQRTSPTYRSVSRSASPVRKSKRMRSVSRSQSTDRKSKKSRQVSLSPPVNRKPKRTFVEYPSPPVDRKSGKNQRSQGGRRPNKSQRSVSRSISESPEVRNKRRSQAHSANNRAEPGRSVSRSGSPGRAGKPNGRRNRKALQSSPSASESDSSSGSNASGSESSDDEPPRRRRLNSSEELGRRGKLSRHSRSPRTDRRAKNKRSDEGSSSPLSRNSRSNGRSSARPRRKPEQREYRSLISPERYVPPRDSAERSDYASSGED
eukprot:193283_1